MIIGVARPAVRAAPYLLAAVASVLLVVVGGVGVAGARIRLGLDSALGTGLLAFGPVGLTVDRLAGLFLVISFTVAVPACLVPAACAARSGWLRRRGLGWGAGWR